VTKNKDKDIGLIIMLIFWALLFIIPWLSNREEDTTTKYIERSPVEVYPSNANAYIHYEKDGYTYFDSYVCTDNCSGHIAGFNWAKDKKITDSNDCGGKSQSFIEGCRVYARTHRPTSYNHSLTTQNAVYLPFLGYFWSYSP